MAFYSWLKSRLVLDKYLVIGCAVLVLIVLYQLYSLDYSTYTFTRLTEPARVERHESLIRDNMDIFGNSPLINAPIVSPRFQVTEVMMRFGIGGTGELGRAGTRFEIIYNDFTYAYRLMAYHPSWTLNTALARLIALSKFPLMFAGAYIAAYAYKNYMRISETQYIIGVLKKQLLTAAGVVSALIFVVSLLGAVVGVFRHVQLENSHAEEMYRLMSLYTIEGLWIPDMLYYISVVAGTFIYLLSCAIFGLILGHVFKSLWFVIAVMVFISAFFHYYSLMFLFLYPVTPFYLLARVSGYFIMAIGVIPIVPDGNPMFHMAVLVLYSVAAIFASFIIMKRRLK